MIYLSIIGALVLATATVTQRFVLKKRKVNVLSYQVFSFLVLFLITFPLALIFWKFLPEALAPQNIFILIMVVFISVIANVFAASSMKWEKISNIEPAKILEPLFTILLAVGFSFIFGVGLYERNMKVLIPAVIAGLALIFSHIKKHHLKFNKYFLMAIAGSFFFALELVLSRLILDYYSPITFYMIRCFGIFLFSFLIFRPKFMKLGKKVKLEVIGMAVLFIIYRIIIYTGYTSLGIVQTTLIIMLGPIFIYIFAHKFLHEKMNWKNIVASVVILLCVLYAVLA